MEEVQRGGQREVPVEDLVEDPLVGDLLAENHLHRLYPLEEVVAEILWNEGLLESRPWKQPRQKPWRPIPRYRSWIDADPQPQSSGTRSR